MKSTRRAFLTQTSLAGGALMAAGVLRGATPVATGSASGERKPVFNMCGYAAPGLERVRIGVIGIGARGSSAVRRLALIEAVELKALCDVVPDKIARAQKELASTAHQPVAYSGGENAWKEMAARDDLDLIYICTPWDLHTPMAVFAMEHGKHAAVEVPAATTLEECWQLVETSERTRKHCMMLENCCYDFFELLTLNMARQGYFGDIVHGEGAYLHDLMALNFSKTDYYELWRLRENFRNGNLYPTHGLGPICQVLDINRGDRMDYLVSVSTDDFQMEKRAKELAEKDSTYAPFAGKKFRGNMNTTTIRTVKGRTIMLQHDVTSQRPYSRLHTVVGTKATAQKYPLPARISKGHEWVSAEEFKKLEEAYTFELVKTVGDRAREVGGHGGMDFLMDWRLIDLLR
ncbi:MAG TPA: Gfo/Idh/MocA family oxidoreductase, partial [Opitutus sp.]|nr:Gfo/Idh/MocA family oxidoreductase [Opitutus sp.]